MFSYKFPIAVGTSVALLQPPIVIAQDIEEVNNIARNISVKITGYGNGSGFILEREGNIYSVVTNKHVVPIDTEYEIQTYDGTKHQVTEGQEIPDLDLAIIKFESTEEYEVAELGDSDELIEQQSISVVGFPGEQTDIDIVRGDLRSIRRDIIANPESSNGYALIYTNQTLPGSSGGVVLDERGRVVAINGEGETDIKTGREISRGIPINTFLVAKDKLRMKPVLNIENNSSEVFSRDGVFKLDMLRRNRTLERTLSDHSSIVRSVVISGNKIISGSWDDTIKVWQLQQ